MLLSVWCGVCVCVVWCDVVWCGVVWCDVVCGVVWCVCVSVFFFSSVLCLLHLLLPPPVTSSPLNVRFLSVLIFSFTLFISAPKQYHQHLSRIIFFLICN